MHFLDIDDFGQKHLRHLLDLAKQMKKGKVVSKPLEGKQLAMIFEKNSTRTRVSFEVGANQLGGHALFLDSNSMQLGRGETVSDTAKVLSRFVDLIMIRCHEHTTLVELAKNATVPVINGLTDYSHPCQIMADILTFEEHQGSIEGQTIAWIGDGNNVLTSWIHAAVQLGFALRIATPEELAPNPDVLEWASKKGGDVMVTRNPKEAVKGAKAINADCWVSMGDKDAERRRKLLEPYQVNSALMDRAPDAIFMHCLPAHRGEEVTANVIDGERSVVFDEAENRLHAQKAIMAWCMEQKG